LRIGPVEEKHRYFSLWYNAASKINGVAMSGKVTNKAILSSSIFSINLVTYPTNHSVMQHIDPVQQGRYYKLNFVLIKPKAGGVFKCSKCIINLFNRIYLFRPDKYDHSVSKIESGKRVLLSFALNL
jgi:hypothetical protein